MALQPDIPILLLLFHKVLILLLPPKSIADMTLNRGARYSPDILREGFTLAIIRVEDVVYDKLECWQGQQNLDSLQKTIVTTWLLFVHMKDGKTQKEKDQHMNADANTNNRLSHNQSLVRAIICSGLFPGIASVVPRETSMSFKTMDDGQVLLYAVVKVDFSDGFKVKGKGNVGFQNGRLIEFPPNTEKVVKGSLGKAIREGVVFGRNQMGSPLLKVQVMQGWILCGFLLGCIGELGEGRGRAYGPTLGLVRGCGMILSV
ncbi:DExH-box ATP-dependent RNA helicase DExH3 [Vitis vinifera]|uniref:DExH-box ATP-dependent RNA helicase DExH3 n=1 Tax=Vitis vinifera TaxID=29760 RepID=A0A438GQZ5_VITVI|nr:DExH-box ATP-dependent RNA helicase DExH3 [Vitis vinifera]